ncbi:hemagglutinin repeat-containing protein, partial [Xanthomonas oryzae]|nr:hemagglutinin repeat-containing protein [Xanthomonas oryzae pv. oryzicola]
TTQQSATTKGSTLQAGGNVNLIATGGGEDSNILVRGSDLKGGNVNLIATGGGEDSNILVRGSDLKAGNNLLLSADHDIT